MYTYVVNMVSRKIFLKIQNLICYGFGGFKFWLLGKEVVWCAKNLLSSSIITSLFIILRYCTPLCFSRQISPIFSKVDPCMTHVVPLYFCLLSICCPLKRFLSGTLLSHDLPFCSHLIISGSCSRCPVMVSLLCFATVGLKFIAPRDTLDLLCFAMVAYLRCTS